MKKELFKKLVTSLKQARDISRGKRKSSRAFTHEVSRVKAIRVRTKLSQREFARLMGVSVRTLQNWEQSRREPRGPAAALLRIVDRAPEIAVQALHRN